MSRQSATYKTHRRLYWVWAAMIQRCHNPANKRFADYGERGVAVCDRWRRSFQAFFDDMGDAPAGMSIDRINNAEGYAPGNCRWATKFEQAANRSLRRDSKTKVAGVTWHRRIGAYQVAIRRNNARRYVGQTPDFFEACCLRKSAETNISA